MRRTTALIVGGGPAGAAAAITLSRAGMRPEILEKAAGPHDVVCGAFLGWDALSSLDRLGLDVWPLGARRIEEVRLVSGERTIVAPLPRTAAVLSRRLLDSTLLEMAEREGAVVRRDVSVRSASGATVKTASGEEISAEAMFLATGKHDLRGIKRSRVDQVGGQVLGLRCAIPSWPGADSSLAGALELHLFGGGYAGAVLQEDGTVNLCISLDQSRMNKMGRLNHVLSWIHDEVPSLRTALEHAAPNEWNAISRVPYGWRARDTQAGVFRVGDQGAVIASLVGDGIAMALGSGMQAAGAYLNGGAEAALNFQRRYSREVQAPLRLATLLRFAAEHDWARSTLLYVISRAPGLVGWAALATRAGDRFTGEFVRS